MGIHKDKGIIYFSPPTGAAIQISLGSKIKNLISFLVILFCHSHKYGPN